MFESSLFGKSEIVFIIIGISFIIILLCILTSIYVYTKQKRRKKQSREAIAKKRLIYSSPASITPEMPTKATNRFVFPLPKLENSEISSKTICEASPSKSINDLPSNYKTFDLAKRYQRHLSSDSSYNSSNYRSSHPLPSFSFDAVKSKVQQVHHFSTPSSMLSRTIETANAENILHESSSDFDEQDDEPSTMVPSTSSLEYSISDVFRIEFIYKLHYSIDDEQLLFQVMSLKSTQPLIERCFVSLICKIRLYAKNDKRTSKKYFSKKDPINEIFKFDLDQFTLEQSSLEIHVLGQHKNGKRIELCHTTLLLNQYDNLMIRSEHHHNGGLAASERHIQYISMNEDKIDMITQQQATSENEARALISLVYENDRCLLHVGVIKIIGIQCLLKQSISQLQHREMIQIKIYTIIDGKITAKRKSKPILIDKNLFTFSTSFHFEYLSLHKTSIRITICYRKTIVSSQNKPISIIEFGSTQLKNQHVFQHWTDTLAGPNRPHVYWHRLEIISKQKEK